MQSNYAQVMMKLRAIAIEAFGKETRPEGCPLSQTEIEQGFSLGSVASVSNGMNVTCIGKEAMACVSCKLKTPGIFVNQ